MFAVSQIWPGHGGVLRKSGIVWSRNFGVAPD